MAKDPYRRIAGRYDLQTEAALRELRKTTLEVYPPRENISILDAGCGTGTQLGLFNRSGCKLYGVDASPAMVDVARRKLGDSAELSVQDISHMNFPDRTFDLITVILTLHEMSPLLRQAVLAECKRLLKTDGRILLADFHFGPYAFPAGYIYRIVRILQEISAGREHFANYRDFKKRGGLKPLSAEIKLSTEKIVVVGGGTAAIHLLQLQ